MTNDLIVEVLTYHRSQPVKETAAPWFMRQAEYEGIVIVVTDLDLLDEEKDGKHISVGRYMAFWHRLPFVACVGVRCRWRHQPTDLDAGAFTYQGDDFAEAERAYAELERQLLKGELK